MTALAGRLARLEAKVNPKSVIVVGADEHEIDQKLMALPPGDRGRAVAVIIGRFDWTEMLGTR